jgi:ubiquinone/menaquinone biosynthesis C-methylase UbiE
MMDPDRLLIFLRCISCGVSLKLEGDKLACRACGREYPLIDNIPAMLSPDAEEKVWENYFGRLTRRKGDHEAANSYFSLKNFELVRSSVLGLIGKARGLSILDVGCGTGHLLHSLAGKNQVVGVDISLTMLTFARSKGFFVVQSSGKKLPFETGGFELVTAINVLQSLKEGNVLTDELVRVTKPGGRIIVSTPNGQNLAMGLFKILEKKKYRHLGVYTAEELKGYFRSAGCKVESVLFLHYPLGKASRVPGDEAARFLDRRLATGLVVEAVKTQTRGAFHE